MAMLMHLCFLCISVTHWVKTWLPSFNMTASYSKLHAIWRKSCHILVIIKQQFWSIFYNQFCLSVHQSKYFASSGLQCFACRNLIIESTSWFMGFSIAVQILSIISDTQEHNKVLYQLLLAAYWVTLLSATKLKHSASSISTLKHKLLSGQTSQIQINSVC